MKPIKLVQGELVQVIFLDHVEDGSQPVRCHVVGRVKTPKKLYEGKSFVEVESWFFDDKEPDAESYRHNVKTFVLLWDVILEIRKLREVKK